MSDLPKTLFGLPIVFTDKKPAWGDKGGEIKLCSPWWHRSWPISFVQLDDDTVKAVFNPDFEPPPEVIEAMELEPEEEGKQE